MRHRLKVGDLVPVPANRVSGCAVLIQTATREYLPRGVYQVTSGPVVMSGREYVRLTRGPRSWWVEQAECELLYDVSQADPPEGE